MGSLVNVERLVDPDEPIAKGKQLQIGVYFPPRLLKRWNEVMPPRSLSWFLRSAAERFLDEIEELPNDTVARVCRLLADDLAHKRHGPILKKNIRY